MGYSHLLPVLGALAAFGVLTEGAHVKRFENGGLEIDLDLTDFSELPEKLNEYASQKERRTLEGIELGRTYSYDEGTDASLLNQLIAFFLPHVNSLVQGLIPDPLAAPVQGRLNLPEVNMFGYCTANAGFDVNFGTLRGLSGINIDRLQVMTGTEKIQPGWSITNGCFETFWSAIIDVGISGLNALTVDDMAAGIHGRACNYDFNEQITGGLMTEKAQIRAAVKMDGVLLGTLARINFVDFVHDVEVGYESITGSIDQAPPALNRFIANVTRSLSVLARDELTTFLMKDQLDHTVAPTINARMVQGLQDQEISLSYSDALSLSKGFINNGARRQIDNFANGAAQFLDDLGLGWGGDEDVPQDIEDNTIAGDSIPNQSLTDTIYGAGEQLWIQAAKIMSGLGLGIGPQEEQDEDQGIVEGQPSLESVQSGGIVPQQWVEDFVSLFKDAQQAVLEGAGGILNAVGVDVNPNQDVDQAIAGGGGPGSDVITEETINHVTEQVGDQVANAVDGVGVGLGIAPAGEDEVAANEEETYGIFPPLWDSVMNLVTGIRGSGGGGTRYLR